MKTLKKFFFTVTSIAIGLILIARISLEFESVQDFASQQGINLLVAGSAPEPYGEDSLKIFVCGSASPIPAPGRAQGCVAVLTPTNFYLVDSGAGSTNNVTQSALPLEQLQGMFITHFHSDHIAEIPEINMLSWVQGRPEPLQVFGPKGIKKVVRGLNAAYELDSAYRSAHHGEELLPPDLSKLQASQIKTGIVLEDGDLTVTAYIADHAPINPAVGYRFDYKGRSVVISGDSNVTDHTREITKGVDLLLHDALSVPIISTMSEAAAKAGMPRSSKVLSDVIDYHASTSALIELEMETDIGMVALYHLVPAPRNIVMQKIFERNLPENFVIAEDRMWFELPVGGTAINVTRD
jgi:ribonuclease Z